MKPAIVGTAWFSLMAMSACSVFTPKQTLPPSPAPSIVASSTPTKSTQPKPPAGDVLLAAEDKATSAANLTQLAQTQDDWNLAVLQWQRAIALLKSIPVNTPQRAIAKKRLVEYERNLSLAKRRVKTTISTAPTVPASQEGIPLIAGPDSISSKADIQAAESEASKYLKALNSAQQTQFLEKKGFVSNLEDLKLGLPSETPNYVFRMESVSAESVLSVAIAKRGGLKSYSSAIYVMTQAQGKQIVPSIVCVTNQPTTFPPDMPELSNNQLKCPANSVPG
jgi:hypothetical protein